MIFSWRPILLLCDPLWVWDSPCVIGLGLNGKCAEGCRSLMDETRLLYIYIHIIGRIPSPLYYLLTTHCSIDVTFETGDREGVEFPVPDVCNVSTLLQLILFDNMASRGMHIKTVYCNFSLSWYSKLLVLSNKVKRIMCISCLF